MDQVPFIENSLQAAAKIANRYFGKVSQSIKTGDNNQVLTETDLEVGQYLVSEVEKNFPEDNILDEEAGVIDRGASRTWVIDPIDGTSNFAEGLPTYGIMIGLLENNQPTLGGLVLPAFDEVFVGGRDHPTTKNGQSVSCSTKEKLLNCLVAYGIDGHQENPDRTHQEAETLGKIVLGIRNLRSTNSAYDMAKTVEGKYALFLNQTTKVWDNVAIQALIEGAGGICTDFYGQPIDYSQTLTNPELNYTICAGPEVLHRQIQDIIGS